MPQEWQEEEDCFKLEKPTALVSGDRAEMRLSKKNSLVLSTKEAILKAEILQALYMV